MGDLAGIYVRLVGSRIRSQVSYRASFAMRVVGNFMVTIIDFLAILVIFSHLPVFAGWTIEEVAFLYGSAYIATRLADMAVGHIENLPELIRSGSLDGFLVRPLSSLFQVLTSDFALRQIGGIAQGAVIFVIAVARLDVVWTPGRVLMVPVMLACGTAIFAGIWIAGNCIAFWLIDSREVANAFTYGGNALTQFPLHVYGAWLRRLAIFAVPVAFVNYYPALYVLGRSDPLGYPSWFRFAGPLAAAAALVAGGAVWRFAVRRYRSTGT